ncbi:MAG TPA: NAD(P)H-dependent oxidoreductase [Rubrivivax sp.]|nr:NAD(P)H-dependent oxidoreductase [Rubrivivax sp.]
MSPKTLLVVWHSLTGGSRQMAEAAAEGARLEAGVQLRVRHARAAGADDLLAADGCLFVAPENLATMAGVMKDFFDRSYYGVLGRIEGRPYAAMICAGSDGQGAARQIERICTGWRLKAVAPALIVCTHAQTPEAILAPKTIAPDELARCRELGQALASGIALGIW